MEFELRLLRHAVALAEHGSFARAAHAMHVSQPTLSRSVQELERRTGTSLFDRKGANGVEPTDVGNVFLEYARQVLSQAADFEREMDLFKGLEKGELHVGAGAYPGPMIVDTALARLISRHPSVRVTVLHQAAHYLLAPLRRREIDLAVIAGPPPESGPELQITELSPHPGFLVVRAEHPLMNLSPEERTESCWEYPFALTSRLGPAALKQFAAAFLARKDGKQATGKSFPSIGCDSLEMLKAIVSKSDCITLLPLNMIAGEIERGELVAFPGLPWMQAKLAIVRLAHRSLSPLGESFVKLLQESDAELLDWEKATMKKLFRQANRQPTSAGSERTD